MEKIKAKPKNSFKEKVREVVRSIPRGKTLSYAEVALKAGHPKASRVVGNIMAWNTDKTVPCHRVIKSDGTLGGYNGLRGGKQGIEAKRALLAEEGVLI